MTYAEMARYCMEKAPWNVDMDIYSAYHTNTNRSWEIEGDTPEETNSKLNKARHYYVKEYVFKARQRIYEIRALAQQSDCTKQGILTTAITERESMFRLARTHHTKAKKKETLNVLISCGMLPELATLVMKFLKWGGKRTPITKNRKELGYIMEHDKFITRTLRG